MVTNRKNNQTLNKLRGKWVFILTIGLISWISFFLWLRTWWATPNPLRWFLLSGLVMVYLHGVLWRGLKDNHRPGESALLPTLGAGNLLSIARGFILVVFFGFLFSPWPENGWKAWLPGLLFTLAALPDFLDGVAARLTNHVTRLGETLDVSIDSIAVLGVTILSVQYGQVPWWYLPVGLARYLFLAGIWIREKFGLQVVELPFSVRRRGYAGLTMGLFFVILYPVFTPPGTHIAASVFAVYLLGGFSWDWFVTIGWIPPHPGPRYLKMENLTLRFLPVILRFLLISWTLLIFLPALLVSPSSILLWAETLAITCLIFGLAGRAVSIAALVFLGLQQSAYPLDSYQIVLIVIYTNLLFLGTGDFSLWPIENHLIYKRIGETE